MIPATYGCFQVSNAWAASVAPRPKVKRAVALALNNSFGNTALIWTPYLYPASAGPKYTVAWSVNLALCVVGILSAVMLRFILQRKNKALEREYNSSDSHSSNDMDKPATVAIEDINMDRLESGKAADHLGEILNRERVTWRFQV